MLCIKSYSYRHVFSLLFYFKLCWILVRKPMVSPHTEFPSVATIQAKPCTNARTTDAQWSLFSLKSRIFGLGQTNWADKFWGISCIFGPNYILVQLVFCPCFPLFNHYLYKKVSLYIHIPNIYLGLGLEFRPQRIRDLAFGVSVVRVLSFDIA